MKPIREVQRTFQEVPDLMETSEELVTEESNGYVPALGAKEHSIPQKFLREKIKNFPNLNELEVVRHFSRLASLNFSIDTGFYPLGSCTMKYNPKINEVVAAEEGFASLHPYTPETYCQGALELMCQLQEALIAITGMKACSLHPAAGAQGELVGIKMINAYHKERGDAKRKVVLIPDSAHGTNPATAMLSGLRVRKIPTNQRGTIDVEALDKVMNEEVAALMLTQPNTLGVFEDEIPQIAKMVHERGGLIYCDGANLNALVGKVDFGKMDVDVMHINLHKTFSTPHGGGGPGAGPVVVSGRLEKYLPIPVVRRKGVQVFLDRNLPSSVGSFRMYYGNFAMLVRALCYIYAFGKEKLHEISEGAVLKANYIKAGLREHFHLPYESPTLHEVVFSDKRQQKENHVSTLDMAKRLMDFGIHPPTVYFPLVVSGAIMIEPTETEPLSELDCFIQVMKQIAKEAKDSPEIVKKSPHRVGLKRLDETHAARHPVLTWNKSD